MSKEYINPHKNKGNKCIRKALGYRMASDYEIVAKKKIPGTQYKYYSPKIPAEAITLPA